MHLSSVAKDFFAIRTCYKCRFYCTCTAQFDPDHTVCDDPKIVCLNGSDSLRSKGFLFEQSMISFVSLPALSAPFNRLSLMVRYVYIRPVHNIGKKLVILLRGGAHICYRPDISFRSSYTRNIVSLLLKFTPDI